METFTLYVGQGALAAVRAGNEALIIDAHMPDGDDVTRDQIERTLASFVAGREVRGLILTGLDDDHGCPAGVESILTKHEPNWVMYPKYYKDTTAATDVFAVITREVKRREKTARPLTRISVRVDLLESRFFPDLTNHFSLETFSPHMEDMDSSNNCSIVLKITGRDATGFNYLVTGDTEKERWDRINAIFGTALGSEVLAAPHHGALSGLNAKTLLLVNPDTVLISAGVDNQYGHPDPAAVNVYSKVAKHVYATNVEGGVCLFTRRVGEEFETTLVRHFERAVESASARAVTVA